MNHSMLMAGLIALLGLAACDRQPAIVNVPSPVVTTVPMPIAIPGPAGPQGVAGNQGDKGASGAEGAQGNQGNPGFDGRKGETGKTGEGTTVIVVPPAASQPAAF